MRFFPWLTEEFTSPLPPAEVRRRLAGITVSKAPFALFGRPKTSAIFQGEVGADRFEIRRIIGGRNSMLPLISGWLRPESGGSRLRLRHRLHLFILAFAAVWLLGAGSIAAGFLGAILTSDPRIMQGPFLSLLGPFVMLVFGLALFTIPFWLEVRKSRPQLVQLLELAELPAA